MSRRARSFPVWATLRAYGREGYRAIVERHLDLAQRMAARVDEAPDLERLADVPLNIVCFRFRPHGCPGAGGLDDLNRRLGEAVIADGRVAFGTTDYGGRVAFRPALANWRIRERRRRSRVVDVTRELGAGLVRPRVTAPASRARGFSRVGGRPYTPGDNCIWGCTGFDLGVHRSGEAGRDPGCHVKRRTTHKRQRRVRARCLSGSRPPRDVCDRGMGVVSRLTPPVRPRGRRGTSHRGWPKGTLPVGAPRRDFTTWLRPEKSRVVAESTRVRIPPPPRRVRPNPPASHRRAGFDAE